MFGRYQARLIELQQKGGLGLQQIQALATEELLEEYIRNKCARRPLPIIEYPARAKHGDAHAMIQSTTEVLP